MTPVSFISTALERDKKEAPKKQRSLRNEKRKGNRASETEERRKKRLRIRREKDRARRTKKLQEEKKRSSETEDHEKLHLATLKRLKRSDEK